MGYGSFGQVLNVDLSTGVVGTRPVAHEAYRTYLGGSGLGARWHLDEVPADADPLGPDNQLIFLAGLLVGTPTPAACKVCLVCRSPLTGIWLEAAAGGRWPAEMTRSGFDGVILRGSATEPTYLWIDNGHAELRPAGHVWGLDTFATSEQLLRETASDARVACIGPAGEGLSRIASVMFDGRLARAAGRGGAGAVMGSKNLKAIVVRGRNRPRLADPEGLRNLLRREIPALKENAKGLAQFSTAGGVEAVEFHGDLPIKNWQLGSFTDGAKKTGAQTFLPQSLKRSYYCSSCPIGCAKYLDWTSDDGQAIEGHGPEYETCAGFGANCLNDDWRVIVRANDLCNRLGLDTISASGVVAFALEAFDRGAIAPADADGRELRWGDGEAIVWLVEAVGRGQGIGRLLGEGVRRAAAELGHGAEEYAVHTKGMEYPYHDPRAFVSMACNYATANRGACHLEALSYFLGRGVPLADLGYTEPPDPHIEEGKANICYDMQNYQSVFNPLGLCKFLFLARVGPSHIARWMRHVTGWDVDQDELMMLGERLFNLKRMYNVRLGISRKDDVLPPRLLSHARPDGRAAGVLPHLGKQLYEYYQLRGWSPEGIPTAHRLRQLGLGDLGGAV